MKKLNLGCGEDIRDGWENYDKFPVNDKIKEIDLEKLPLPFPDNYADEIVLNHVFEHLNINRYMFMRELSRILKKNGKLIIAVPVNHQCIEHEQIFFTWDYFKNLKTDKYGNLFSDISFKVSKNSFRDIIWKIKLFIFWITKHEIVYKLKK